MSEQLINVPNDVDRVAFGNLQHENLQAGKQTGEKRPLTPEELLQGQADWEGYLNSRPTEEEISTPGTASLYADEYFDEKRRQHEENPVNKDGTPKAYEEMTPSQLARKLAQAEFFNDQTIQESVTDVLNDKLDDLDEKFASESDEEHNDLRSQKLDERIEKIKERELNRLKAEHGAPSNGEASRSDEENEPDEPGDGTPVTDETDVLPLDEESERAEDKEAESVSADDDEMFEGEPQDDNEPAKKRKIRDSVAFNKFKEGVRKHLREYPIKGLPPKQEDYEHPLDKFDRLYTLPAKAKVNRKAAEVSSKVKDAAERAEERHEYARRVGRLSRFVIHRAVMLPAQWDEYLRFLDEPSAKQYKKEERDQPAESAKAPEPGIIGNLRKNAGVLADEIRESSKGAEEEPLQQDPRFTPELSDALKGESHLAGDKVEIIGYKGSRQTENGVQHFIEYEDAEGNKKFTTLDQFLWMDLPAERRKELEDAGVNPYDLVAGTDPILKPNA